MDIERSKGIFLDVMVDFNHFSLFWNKSLPLLRNIPNSLESKWVLRTSTYQKKDGIWIVVVWFQGHWRNRAYKTMINISVLINSPLFKKHFAMNLSLNVSLYNISLPQNTCVSQWSRREKDRGGWKEILFWKIDKILSLVLFANSKI